MILYGLQSLNFMQINCHCLFFVQIEFHLLFFNLDC